MSVEILIVDDNADIRNILNELIIDAGYKTRIAANYNQVAHQIAPPRHWPPAIQRARRGG